MGSFLPNDRLSAVRVARKLSRQQLADALRVGCSSVVRWERGECMPSRSRLVALCAFFKLSALDLGFPGTDPDPNTNPAVRQVVVETPVILEALADPGLPSLSENLVGREESLGLVRDRLRSATALTALHGLPGVGKTALATALAYDTELQEHFVDGVLWAGLGPQPNLPGLLSRWGSLLGVSATQAHALRGVEDWSRTLRMAIGERRLLIVIDDAWQVEAALACKVGGPQCRHLVTTRFPAIAAYLAVDGVMHLQELNEHESLALLQHLAPDFMSAEEQAGLELVRAAGGLPLALLLMGNYLRSHRYATETGHIHVLLQVLQDAEVRLRLTEPELSIESHPGLGTNTSLSLQSVIAVTDQFLSEPARAAFYALSILPAKPNSFSEEAALALAACSTDELDLLSDSGLLECSNAGRYMLHQVIADYAHMYLPEPARREAGRCLIAYVIGYIDTHQKAYELLEVESSTIVAALNLAYELQEHAALMQAVCAFAPYLILRGFYTQAEVHLTRAYETAKAQNDEVALAGGILLYLGEVAQKQGNFDLAEAHFQEGLQLARKLDDDERICDLLTDLGSLTWRRGSYVQAESYLREGLALARQTDHYERTYTIFKYLGAVLGSQGNLKAAKKSFQEGLKLAQLVGDREQECILWGNLGVVVEAHGKSQQAEAYFLEGLQIARQIGHREQMCVLLLNLGNAKKDVSDYTQAEVFFREGLALARQIGHREWASALLSDLGSVLLQQQNHVQAGEALQESLILARQIERPQITCNALNAYGHFYLKNQQIDEAEQCFHEILRIAPEDDHWWYATAHYGLARIAAARGDFETARTLGKVSMQVLEKRKYAQSQEIKNWLATLNL